jgi:hypothetical protein
LPHPDAYAWTYGAKLRCVDSPLVIYLKTADGLEPVEDIEFHTKHDVLAWAAEQYPDLPYQP